MSGVLVLASARETIADYLQALIFVYIILIFVYIVAQLFFGFGGRVPYNRSSNAVLEFLRQVCEPFLSIFRRIIPPLGPLVLWVLPEKRIVSLMMKPFRGWPRGAPYQRNRSRLRE